MCKKLTDFEGDLKNIFTNDLSHKMEKQRREPAYRINVLAMLRY